MKKYYEFINNLPEFVNINGYDKPTTVNVTKNYLD